MILHCVFCHFRHDVSASERHDILGALAEFSKSLTGVVEFEFGPNRDFERKSQPYGDGFVIRFVDRAALEVYAKHPTHIKLGGELCELCEGGADGIMVFDLEI